MVKSEDEFNHPFSAFRSLIGNSNDVQERNQMSHWPRTPSYAPIKTANVHRSWRSRDDGGRVSRPQTQFFSPAITTSSTIWVSQPFITDAGGWSFTWPMTRPVTWMRESSHIKALKKHAFAYHPSCHRYPSSIFEKVSSCLQKKNERGKIIIFLHVLKFKRNDNFFCFSIPLKESNMHSNLQ